MRFASSQTVVAEEGSTFSGSTECFSAFPFSIRRQRSEQEPPLWWFGCPLFSLHTKQIFSGQLRRSWPFPRHSEQVRFFSDMFVSSSTGWIHFEPSNFIFLGPKEKTRLVFSPTKGNNSTWLSSSITHGAGDSLLKEIISEEPCSGTIMRHCVLVRVCIRFANERTRFANERTRDCFHSLIDIKSCSHNRDIFCVLFVNKVHPMLRRISTSNASFCNILDNFFQTLGIHLRDVLESRKSILKYDIHGFGATNKKTTAVVKFYFWGLKKKPAWFSPPSAKELTGVCVCLCIRVRFPESDTLRVGLPLVSTPQSISPWIGRFG